jgi:hypothetical protein
VMESPEEFEIALCKHTSANKNSDLLRLKFPTRAIIFCNAFCNKASMLKFDVGVCSAYTHTFITFFVIILIEISLLVTLEFYQLLCTLLTPLQHASFRFWSSYTYTNSYAFLTRHLCYCITIKFNTSILFFYIKRSIMQVYCPIVGIYGCGTFIWY